MLRSLLILGSAIGILAFSIGLAPADEATDDYNLAIGLYKNTKWVFAEEAFQKFITKHSKHTRVPLARYYLGLTQRENKKLAEARATLRAFTKDFPQSENAPRAQYVIGECSYEIAEFEVASQEFETFIKTTQDLAKDPQTLNADTEYEIALTYLGDCYRRLGKYREAIATLEKSLKIFANGRYADEAKFWLAQSFEGNNQVDRAFDLFKEIAATPGASRGDAAQLQVANILFQKAQYPEAVEAYARIEKDFPKSRHLGTAQLNQGYAHYQVGEFAKAMVAFDRAQKTEPIKAGYWKGIAAKALGDFQGAAEILQDVAKKSGKDPLAENTQFQLADCYFRAGKTTDAETAFLEVVTRWPTGRLAAESLYFAIDCGLEQIARLNGDDRTNKLKQVELLVEKFAREFGNTGFRLSHQIQRAQLLTLKATDDDRNEAEMLLLAVIGQSEQPATINEARFRLARLRQSRGNSSGAIEAIKPLADQIIKTPEIGFHDALVVYLSLQFDAGQFAEVLRASESYVKIQPPGRQRDQVLSATAMAHARLKDWDQAAATVARVQKEHAESALIPQTMQSVAQIAMDQKQWDRALPLFQSLEKLPAESPYRPAAISELGWVYYHKQVYADAESQFRRLIKEYPQHELAAHGAFMIGDSLQKAKKLDEANVAFGEAFKGYKPSRYAFLAGLQAARIAIYQKKIDLADKTYGEIDAAFPEAKERDLVLNEWAVALSEAEKHERADEVYRTLVAKFPESPHADNARYALAENALGAGHVEAAEKEFKDLAASTKSDQEVQENSLFQLIAIAKQKSAWKDVTTYQKSFDERFPQSEHLLLLRFHAADAYLNLKEDAAGEVLLTSLSQVTDKTIQKANWYPLVWPLLAESQWRQKKYAEVYKTAERARTSVPDAGWHYRVDEVVGRAYSKQALWDEARTAFKRAIRAPEAAATETACKCQFLIGETYFFQKNYKEAHGQFSLVIFNYSFRDWSAAALLEVGKCEENMQQTDEAKKSYRTLIKDYSESKLVTEAKDRLAKLGG